MNTYTGNIKITKDNMLAMQEELKDIEHIIGNLHIRSQASLDVPKLETIGGYLIIRSQASLDVPKLETIGGSLIINSQATLDAPKLSKINGKIYFDGEEISYKEFKIKFARAIPMKFESNSIKVYFTDMCDKHDP